MYQSHVGSIVGSTAAGKQHFVEVCGDTEPLLGQHSWILVEHGTTLVE
jgi:hypothetical protein